MPVARETAKIGFGNSERQERRPRRGRYVAARLTGSGDVRAGAFGDRRDGVGQGFGRRAVEQRGGGDAGIGQQRERYVEAALAGVKGDCAQNAGETETETRLARGRHRRLVLRPEDFAGELHQGNGGAPDIGFQGVEVGGRTGVQIGGAAVDDRLEARAIEAVAVYRLGERGNHRVLANRPGIDPVDRFAPPLQPDFTQHRLGDDFGGLRGLEIEGVKRVKPVAARGRGEQRRKIALAVEAAHLRRAVGSGLGVHHRVTKPAYIGGMRPITPLDTGRLEAWPEIVACAAALEDARALADDTARPVDERRDALARLAEATDDLSLKRAYQAREKALTVRRFRNWSDLVSYAGFAVAPVAGSFGAASGLDAAERRPLEVYCVAAHILDLAVHCRDEYRTHDRIYLPGDWLRSAKVAPEDLAKRKARPGLRSVLDRLLDRIDPMMADAFAAACAIADADLRQAAMEEIAERRRLARRLRRRDPLAGPVGLTALDRAMVWFQLRRQRRGGA